MEVDASLMGNAAQPDTPAPHKESRQTITHQNTGSDATNRTPHKPKTKIQDRTPQNMPGKAGHQWEAPLDLPPPNFLHVDHHPLTCTMAYGGQWWSIDPCRAWREIIPNVREVPLVPTAKTTDRRIGPLQSNAMCKAKMTSSVYPVKDLVCSPSPTFI